MLLCQQLIQEDINMKWPFISIIIPTYNRSNLLSLTLDSFLAQNYDPNMYEIIVANNNSTDQTQNIIDEYCHKYSKITSFVEKRQGVHYARNSAAKFAKGEILYFTDDDMIADQNLLKEIVVPFLIDDKVSSVTGKVLPKWEQPPPEWVLHLCLNYLLSLQDKPEDLIISSSDFGVFSCHQAIRKEVFFQSGGFNPENTAGEWIGDGETGLNIKIKELGYKFAYIGSSVIYHIIPPSRTTQAYLNKRLANQGNSDSYTDYRKHRYKKKQLIKNVLSHIVKIVISTIKMSYNFVLCRNIYRIKLARIFYYINRIKYDYRLIQDEEWRTVVLKMNWLDD